MNTNDPKYGKQRKTEDLTGNVYGKVTLLRRVDNKRSPNGKAIVMWECQCECGKLFTAPSSGLKNGHYKSCGCSRVEHHEQNWSRPTKNTYDLSHEYGIGFTPKGEKFLFDLEDYDKIKGHTWSYNNSGYLAAKTFKNHIQKNYLLHRIVMDAPSDMVVDHINGSDSLFDNRKSNLRIVTQQQNSMNSATPKNNKSGSKGVYWCKKRNKWIVQIGYNRKTINLGKYDCFEDAVKARENAEKKYYGEYSYLNRTQEVIK